MRGKRAPRLLHRSRRAGQGANQKIPKSAGENRKEEYCIKTRPKNQNKNGRILHAMHFSQAQSNSFDATLQTASLTLCQGDTYLARANDSERAQDMLRSAALRLA